MQPRWDKPETDLPPVLVCPVCRKPMRIAAIDAGHGVERVRFICQTCGTEQTQNNHLIS